MSSLPFYTEENVDFQRGTGVFKKVIPALQELNRQDYGTGKYKLHLVYNPGGAFLPGPQAAYKERLFAQFPIQFDQLFTIANASIGRGISLTAISTRRLACRPTDGRFISVTRNRGNSSTGWA